MQFHLDCFDGIYMIKRDDGGERIPRLAKVLPRLSRFKMALQAILIDLLFKPDDRDDSKLQFIDGNDSTLPPNDKRTKINNFKYLTITIESKTCMIC